jgi:N-acetylneuraminic acid mutarotase
MTYCFLRTVPQREQTVPSKNIIVIYYLTLLGAYMLNCSAEKMAVITIIVFLVFACPITSALQIETAHENKWITKSSSIPTREPMVIEANQKIYVIGGMNAAYCLDYNQEYDPKTDTWTTKASMPTPRADAAIAIYQNKIFVIGGTTGAGVQVRYGGGDKSLIGTTDANEAYDPASDRWESKSTLPTNMSYIRAGVVGDKIYVIGGDKNLMYDASQDMWTYRTPPPVAVWKYALAVVNNSLYLFGGVTSPQSYSWSNITQIYDTQTDSWSFGQSLPESFVDPVAAKTNRETAPAKVYVISWANRTNIYDPSNNSWTVGTQMSTQRAAFGAAFVDDLLYVIGGGSGTFPTLYPAYGYNEQYTPIGYRTTSFNLTASPSPTISLTPSTTSLPSTTLTPVTSQTGSSSTAPTLTPTATVPEFPTLVVPTIAVVTALLVTMLIKRRKVTCQ